LFSLSDTGLNKAVVLTTRINRFFSSAWEAIPDFYENQPANILITCTDTAASRLSVAAGLLSRTANESRNDCGKLLYWLDFGNTQNTGQVVLGTFGEISQPQSERYLPVGKLPCVTERFDLTKVDESQSGPSCSLSEAIERQDLFINSTLAHIGAKLLWTLFREGRTDRAGVFLNMDTMNMNPLML
jgi:PRTRC genetic system ThiF family protein